MPRTEKHRNLRIEQMRERLRLLGFKARIDPLSLSLKDIDEICSLVVALGPTVIVYPESPVPKGFRVPFKPVDPNVASFDTRALLRLADAAENMTFQLSEIVRLLKEDGQQRWKASMDKTGETKRHRLSGSTPAT